MLNNPPAYQKLLETARYEEPFLAETMLHWAYFFVAEFSGSNRKWLPNNTYLTLRKNPPHMGFPGGFWHMISDENPAYPQDESKRIINVDRCKSVHKVFDLLEEFDRLYIAPDSPKCVFWIVSREGRKIPKTVTRYAIAKPDFSYVLFIDQRECYANFVTGYPVESEGGRKKFEKEYHRSQKQEPSLQ